MTPTLSDDEATRLFDRLARTVPDTPTRMPAVVTAGRRARRRRRTTTTVVAAAAAVLVATSVSIAVPRFGDGHDVVPSPVTQSPSSGEAKPVTAADLQMNPWVMSFLDTSGAVDHQWDDVLVVITFSAKQFLTSDGLNDIGGGYGVNGRDGSGLADFTTHDVGSTAVGTTEPSRYPPVGDVLLRTSYLTRQRHRIVLVDHHQVPIAVLTPAPDHVGRVIGTVSVIDGALRHPLSGPVYLQPIDGGHADGAVSRADGGFTIDTFPGRYTVAATDPSAGGAQCTSVGPVTVRPGKVVRVQVSCLAEGDLTGPAVSPAHLD